MLKVSGVASGRWKLRTAPARAALLGACVTRISHATMEMADPGRAGQPSGRIRQEREHPPALQLRHADAAAGGGSSSSRKSSAASAAQDVGESRAVADEARGASFLRTGKSKTRPHPLSAGVPPPPPGGASSPGVQPQMLPPHMLPPHMPPPHMPPPHMPPPHMPPPHLHTSPNGGTTGKSTCCDDDDATMGAGMRPLNGFGGVYATGAAGAVPHPGGGGATPGATPGAAPGAPLSQHNFEEADDEAVGPAGDLASEKEDLRKATNLPPGISEVFALRGHELLSSGQFQLKHMYEPTNGNVHYVNEEALLYKKLPETQQGMLIMDGQWQNHGYAHGGQHGYKSFRFESNPRFGPGTVIMWDAEHIPVGHGVWPAYWTTDAGVWPHGGEIDMHEGINMDEHMHSTLHTGDRFVAHPTCRALICHDSKDPTSKDCTNPNCFTGNGKFGCGGEWNRPNGKAYNDAGGALHVLSWTKKWLKMWLWKRSEIPKGLKWNDVSDLGKLADGTMPGVYAEWSFENGKCSHEELKDHYFIINLTLCGDWAGNVFNHNGGSAKHACYQYIKTEQARNEWRELNRGELPHYLLNSLRLYKVPDDPPR